MDYVRKLHPLVPGWVFFWKAVEIWHPVAFPRHDASDDGGHQVEVKVGGQVGGQGPLPRSYQKILCPEQRRIRGSVPAESSSLCRDIYGGCYRLS